MLSAETDDELIANFLLEVPSMKMFPKHIQLQQAKRWRAGELTNALGKSAPPRVISEDERQQLDRKNDTQTIQHSTRPV